MLKYQGWPMEHPRFLKPTHDRKPIDRHFAMQEM